MPMPRDPRWLLISWRPSADEMGPNIKTWVGRLQKVLSVQCADEFDQVQSSQDTTDDRSRIAAAVREDKCTDFLAVYTIDYCLACAAEARDGVKDNELIELAGRIGQSPVRAWVARLEASPPWDARVADHRPWQQRQRWRFLPNDSEIDFFDMSRSDIATRIDRDCVEPLKQRGD